MQVSRTLLANLFCLPKIVNNKVAVINQNSTYSLYRVPQWVSISDDYNPEKYVLVKDSRWGFFIDYIRAKDMEKYLVYKQLQFKIFTARLHDKIHIHSRKGIYTVVDIKPECMVITCRKWQNERHPLHYVPLSDFKSLAGGINNQIFE